MGRVPGGRMLANAIALSFSGTGMSQRSDIPDTL